MYMFVFFSDWMIAINIASLLSAFLHISLNLFVLDNLVCIINVLTMHNISLYECQCNTITPHAYTMQSA